MFIKDIFNQKPHTLSFEVFPPKKSSNFDSVAAAVSKMSTLPIDYMSVTYGAGGSTSKNTAQIAQYMQDELHITALAHLTCISSDKDGIHNSLADLQARGIKNILALRGDIPADFDKPLPNSYKYASQLAADIKSFGGFCVGGACYPECHPDSISPEEDIENLKKKVAAGIDFLVTQMFFDNDAFYRFRDMAAKKGINLPIEAGIMPLTNIKQIERMCILSGGAAMPSKFTRMISKYGEKPEALKQAGIAYAVDQITDLLSNDINGIHLYTMNKPEIAEKIVSAISSLF